MDDNPRDVIRHREHVFAPWTDEIVLALIWRQTGSIKLTENFYQSPPFHPYTCPRDHTMQGVGGHNILIPTPAGWVCPHEICDYTQDWAMAIDVDWYRGQKEQHEIAP